jgi:hypothetical protein
MRVFMLLKVDVGVGSLKGKEVRRETVNGNTAKKKVRKKERKLEIPQSKDRGGKNIRETEERSNYYRGKPAVKCLCMYMHALGIL